MNTFEQDYIEIFFSFQSKHLEFITRSMKAEQMNNSQKDLLQVFRYIRTKSVDLIT